MSNKTQLQTNNNSLDALITRVNAAKDTAASLPEAGSGSGGVSVETCTISIDIGGYTFYYTTVSEDGRVFGDSAEFVNTVQVIKGSYIFIPQPMLAGYVWELSTGLEKIVNAGYGVVIQVSEDISDTASIVAYFD